LERILILLFLFTAATTDAAKPYPQQISGENWTTIIVDCPSNDSGQHIRFRANVSLGVPAQKVGFKWKVKGGKIISGQSTDEITVKSKRRTGQVVTATVQVLGHFERGYNTTASCSTIISDR
jgi:hypothetical protein